MCRTWPYDPFHRKQVRIVSKFTFTFFILFLISFGLVYLAKTINQGLITKEKCGISCWTKRCGTLKQHLKYTTIISTEVSYFAVFSTEVSYFSVLSTELSYFAVLGTEVSYFAVFITEVFYFAVFSTEVSYFDVCYMGLDCLPEDFQGKLAHISAALGGNYSSAFQLRRTILLNHTSNNKFLNKAGLEHS
ncbi:hypothetical protein AVEN_81355-1 [Araneus ventricosus]|uniref:Uncharacterized protein n=1 Tax=Araneus ventricosus TaxID=182803 RepID=A0A4Y2B6W8_ARAVE|nr:hypothetical protein AVEN_81355-1 [Araneus ventricosus]